MSYLPALPAGVSQPMTKERAVALVHAAGSRLGTGN